MIQMHFRHVEREVRQAVHLVHLVADLLGAGERTQTVEIARQIVVRQTAAGQCVVWQSVAGERVTGRSTQVRQARRAGGQAVVRVAVTREQVRKAGGHRLVSRQVL